MTVFSSHLPVEREPGGHDLHERLHELVDVEDPAGGTGACGDAEAAVPGFEYRLLVNLNKQASWRRLPSHITYLELQIGERETPKDGKSSRELLLLFTFKTP